MIVLKQEINCLAESVRTAEGLLGAASIMAHILKRFFVLTRTTLNKTMYVRYQFVMSKRHKLAEQRQKGIKIH